MNANYVIYWMLAGDSEWRVEDLPVDTIARRVNELLNLDAIEITIEPEGE